MKTIIAGSRFFNDYDYLLHVIATCPFYITEVVSGGARGVDQLAIQFAKEHCLPFRVFEAKWSDLVTKPVKVKYDKQGNPYNVLAGFNRNQQMAEYADALIAIHLNNSTGTKDMIERAHSQSIPIHYIDPNR